MNDLFKSALTAFSIVLTLNSTVDAKILKQKIQNTQITTGTYAGIHAGSTETQLTNKESFFFESALMLFPTGLFNGNTGNSPLIDTEKRGSAVFGVTFGARHITSNNIAIGIEIDISKINQTLLSNNQIDLRLMTAVGAFRPSTTTLKHKLSIIPKIFIGYRITPQYLLMAKVGANLSYFELKNTLQTLPTAPNTKADSAHDFSKIGITFGLAIEHAINNAISIVGDASYTYFREMSVTHTNPTNNFINDATHTARIKPRFITAKIGVIYKF